MVEMNDTVRKQITKFVDEQQSILTSALEKYNEVLANPALKRTFFNVAREDGIYYGTEQKKGDVIVMPFSESLDELKACLISWQNIRKALDLVELTPSDDEDE